MRSIRTLALSNSLLQIVYGAAGRRAPCWPWHGPLIHNTGLVLLGTVLALYAQGLATHGTVTAKNAPRRRIISRAYNLTDDRASGPAGSTQTTSGAKASGSVPDRDLTPMLQTLLSSYWATARSRVALVQAWTTLK
jgi:hypothetical protein